MFSRLKEQLIEDNYFRPRWFSVFLNPYFVGRRSIFRAAEKFAASLAPDAKVLDVGCGLKPYQRLFSKQKYIGIDIKGGGHSDENKRADLYFDGINLPFENSSLDALLSTQVLESVVDPEKLCADCARVLKPGGKILITMPFMYPEHEPPYDFRRFTRFEHHRLLKQNGFIDISVQETTGFFGAFGQLASVILFESITIRSTILKLFLAIFILGPIQIVALMLDFATNKAGKKWVTLDYIVKAEKAKRDDNA